MSSQTVNWVASAKALFKVPKPEHFTDYRHCCECAEHDETLLSADIETIGLKELGNPGWDPMCFASPEGKKYYFPALIRLSLETIESEFYLDQFLFHLEWDGPDNDFYLSCSKEQRAFIADFLAYLIDAYAETIENNFSADSALKCYEIWSRP